MKLTNALFKLHLNYNKFLCGYVLEAKIKDTRWLLMLLKERLRLLSSLFFNVVRNFVY